MKWTCNRCHTTNTNDKNICSWCGSTFIANEHVAVKAKHDDMYITDIIIRAIQKLNYTQKTKLYRWMEDNVL